MSLEEVRAVLGVSCFDLDRAKLVLEFHMSENSVDYKLYKYVR